MRMVGRYEILREIGRGGMAIVYAARQPDLDRQVALKELSSFHANSAEFAHRFLRESRLAGSLNHPNIVTVHEYFEHAGTPYIAMELVPRGSLRPYVRRLSLAQVAGVLEGILAALAHAETAGIVHRDMKPENVMVTADGRVKIADFGIARATQRAGTQYVTATGMTVGTPTYMAPEQAMAGEIGPWTDLYSVGVLTYELILGSPPFTDSDTPLAILMRHVNERIPSAIELQPTLDPGLSGWIDSLLVKDPKQRVRHALVAWESLEEIIVGLLGPLWRRDARLLGDHSDAVEADPLTPAPFESHSSIRTPTPQPTEIPGAFITFEPGPAPSPAREPEPSATPEREPVEPEPEREPVEPEPEPFELEPLPVEPEAEPQPEATSEPLPHPEPKLAEPEPESELAEPEPEPRPELAPEPEREAEPSRAREPEPAGTRHSRTNLVVAAFVAAIAAATGFILAPAAHRASAAPVALSQTASSPRLSISYPGTWRQSPATPPGVASPRLSDQVVLVPRDGGGGALVLGTTTATDAALLPNGFAATLVSPPQGTPVKLGPWIYRRYLNLLPRGAAGPQTVYALPTTAGTLIASCVAPSANAPEFASACERAIASLRLESATALPPTANPVFARSLGTVIATLNAARAADGRRLETAKRPADQAASAHRLAVAHSAAATAAGRLAPGPIGAEANLAIVAALHRLGSAYESLAHAAEHSDKRQYGAASTAITQSEAALGAGFAQLRQDGYSIG
jgi:serine/threonine protein kinase